MLRCLFLRLVHNRNNPRNLFFRLVSIRKYLQNLILRLVLNRKNSWNLILQFWCKFAEMNSAKILFTKISSLGLIKSNGRLMKLISALTLQVLKKSKRERENPDQIITHVETNDLTSNKRPGQIAESIIGVASLLKSHTCDVLVSSITIRNDQHRKKVAEVYIVLKELCKIKNLYKS